MPMCLLPRHPVHNAWSTQRNPGELGQPEQDEPIPAHILHTVMASAKARRMEMLLGAPCFPKGFP